MASKNPENLKAPKGQDEVILRVTDLARGGAGVSRDPSGRVVFVPLSAPGDLIRARILETDKRYAQGELLEVLEPSSDRQTPRCPAFGQCGGCQWQHLPYTVQWKTKASGVLHALKRVQVDLSASIQVEELPADQIWEYRNRVQLRGEGSKIGFFRPGSRELVPVERCDIARREINLIWKDLQKEGARLKRGYKVEVEVLPTGEVRKIWISRHSAGGFRQVHDEQNERLRSWIAGQFPEGDVLYDLFGGSGNLSIPLVQKMKQIHCVDLGAPHGRSSDDPPNLHFYRQSVTEWLADQPKQPAGTAFSILDPPREGLAETFFEIATALEARHVKKIVVVGCDVDAWARDLSRWLKRKWKIEKVLLIDLFPQTHHIESVAVLTYT